jgi:formate dehydrogenase maturation protein FdhE
MRVRYLTHHQKKAYVDAHGACCPFCGATNIAAGAFLTEGVEAWRIVHCLAPLCEQAWREVFRLEWIEDARASKWS